VRPNAASFCVSRCSTRFSVIKTLFGSAMYLPNGGHSTNPCRE
jgi:hypothetical protein